MYKIVCKKELNPSVTYMEIEAPFVARKAKAGQFIIFRIDERGERVPLTIAGYDREKGTVSIIFQKVGLSKAASDNLYLMTDDGSYGEKGFVTVKLQELLEAGNQYDEVLAIGPIPMMKFVAKTTEPFGVKTIVSLNPIMVDGTGMCGGCRVTVGGEVKFACVDGPDFDGHKVDFAELMSRNGVYRDREAETNKTHMCRLEKLGQDLIK